MKVTLTEVISDMVCVELLTVDSILSEPDLVITTFRSAAKALIATLPMVFQQRATDAINDIKWEQVIVAAGRKRNER